MTWTRLVLIAAAVAGATPALWAFQLPAQTRTTWDRYITLTEERQAAEIDGRSPFLWIDRQPEAVRDAHMATLKNGGVVVERLATQDGGKPILVKNGLLHHWIGTVFVPDTPISRLTQLIQDYDNYAERFGSTIVRSKIVKQSGGRFEVTMRTSVKKVVTVTQDQEWQIDFRTVSPTRLFVPNIITKLYDVEDADTPIERRTPGDDAVGWLWRLHNYCSFEQRPEGTYEQCESLSLTRPVPWYAKVFVSGYVNNVPRDTLAMTLGQVRETFVRYANGSNK